MDSCSFEYRKNRLQRQNKCTSTNADTSVELFYEAYSRHSVIFLAVIFMHVPFDKSVVARTVGCEFVLGSPIMTHDYKERPKWLPHLKYHLLLVSSQNSHSGKTVEAIYHMTIEGAVNIKNSILWLYKEAYLHFCLKHFILF